VSREAKGVRKAMKKNIFGFALSALLLALCSSTAAQQPKKVPRIGYLSMRDPVGESSRYETMRLALRSLAT
jgi:hypothetical protein